MAPGLTLKEKENDETLAPASTDWRQQT